MKKIIVIFAILMMVPAISACGGKFGGSAAAKEYRVITVDEAGAPVADVTVQFCSDKLCLKADTDTDGVAVFADQEEGKYTIHVLSVPDGYAEDETEYAAPETYGDTTITLKADSE